jgi:hypothetical protein
MKGIAFAVGAVAALGALVYVRWRGGADRSPNAELVMKAFEMVEGGAGCRERRMADATDCENK